MKPRTPVITAMIVLLLPMLYLGSYLALVLPQGVFVHRTASPYSYETVSNGRAVTYYGDFETYRAFAPVCRWLFWPLEQIDRKLRPKSWERPFESGDYISLSVRRTAFIRVN